MGQTLVVSDPLAELARLEGVASAVAAARAAVDAVLRDRGLRSIGPETAASALLAGAQASAELSGDPERWGSGAVRLGAELIPLSAVIRVAPGQAVARAHTLAARGHVPDEEMGRIRLDAELAARLAALHHLLVQPTSAPGLVLAAVAHGELAVLAPFGSADGLVARAVEHMLLIAVGVDPLGVIVCEAGHAADPEAYAGALAGYRRGTATGVRGWILHCARAVAYGAEVSPVTAHAGARVTRRFGATSVPLNGP